MKTLIKLSIFVAIIFSLQSCAGRRGMQQGGWGQQGGQVGMPGGGMWGQQFPPQQIGIYPIQPIVAELISATPTNITLTTNDWLSPTDTYAMYVGQLQNGQIGQFITNSPAKKLEIQIGMNNNQRVVVATQQINVVTPQGLTTTYFVL
ncbi:MAG: hypothetical protein LRY41_03345 [Candidatus Pacebacteria bacterium]|nr:hypothetical protein [Candidatus Paceibacterota bacterium]MCD8508035.1 hypothetical protein [Candidatus Paceibacterota bacterium]MCD8528326.1 hypothetical protein [Candidatus Paceibacterota bacterium]MCD8563815.1 hypothetical protein [Candidatus Paceibacterota bacterium]